MQAFDYATAQLSAVAPTHGNPMPHHEASKFVLLPEWDPEGDGADAELDPHGRPSP